MLVKIDIRVIALLIVCAATHPDRDDEDLENCIHKCMVNAPNPENNENASDFNGSLIDNTTDGDASEYSSEERSECEQKCREGRQSSRRLMVAFVIIIVVSLALCILCLCLRYACYHRIKEWKERRKRKPVPNNLTPDEFASYADEFQTIFTQGQREMWEFVFFANGVPQIMQWFSLEMKRVSDFEYSIKIKGQDIFGVWDGTGFYVNTVQGPVAWWFKDYEDINQESKSQCIYELIRNSLGNYTGVWYLTRSIGVQEATNLQRRFGGRENVREQEIHYELQSAGESDEVL